MELTTGVQMPDATIRLDLDGRIHGSRNDIILSWKLAQILASSVSIAAVVSNVDFLAVMEQMWTVKTKSAGVVSIAASGADRHVHESRPVTCDDEAFVVSIVLAARLTTFLVWRESVAFLYQILGKTTVTSILVDYDSLRRAVCDDVVCLCVGDLGANQHPKAKNPTPKLHRLFCMNRLDSAFAKWRSNVEFIRNWRTGQGAE